MLAYAAMLDFETAAAAPRTLVAGARYFEAATLGAGSSHLEANVVAPWTVDSCTSPLETGAVGPRTLDAGVRDFEDDAVAPRTLVRGVGDLVADAISISSGSTLGMPRCRGPLVFCRCTQCNERPAGLLVAPMSMRTSAVALRETDFVSRVCLPEYEA